METGANLFAVFDIASRMKRWNSQGKPTFSEQQKDTKKSDNRGE